MSAIKSRVKRLEQRLGEETWQDLARKMVKEGADPIELLRECGTVLYSHFKDEWYKDLTEQQAAEIGAEADRRIDEILAPYSDADLQRMIDGTWPYAYPEGL